MKITIDFNETITFRGQEYVAVHRSRNGSSNGTPTSTRHWRTWSHEEDATILAAIKSGKEAHQIVRDLPGRSVKAIRMRMYFHAKGGKAHA